MEHDQNNSSEYIKHRISINLIKTKNNRREYLDLNSFIEDIKLMFDNYFMFTSREDRYYSTSRMIKEKVTVPL